MNDGDDLEAGEEVTGGGAAPADVDQAFRFLLEKLHAEHNFDFRQYKEASLLRRVRRRMAQVRVDRIGDYITYVDQHPDEHTALLNVILINVTRFFRDPEAWTVVRETILPRIIGAAAATHTLRFWSAGCSSGEEPYSLAMLLANALGDARDTYDVKIYGTDIDEDALATARAGLYRLDQVKDIPRELTDRYLCPDGQAFRVRRELRKWCIFGRHDLTQNAPLSHVDMLVCRNVLIYFDSELQNRLAPRFQYALRDGGFLFLGRAEAMPSRARRFTPVDFKWRIFERTKGSDADPLVPFFEENLRARPTRRPVLESAVVPVSGILESLDAAIVIVDPADTIVAWNPAAERMFEIPGDGALGKKFRDLDISYRIEGLRARVEDVKTSQARVQMSDVTFARRSGDVMHANLAIAPIFAERRHLAGIVISGEDVSDVGRVREELDRIAEQSATANEELQSTNEELETTNEELQSTNEELETTNEELQSTNEELETTVEELQSINAELGTLNTELERRTADLNRLDTLHRSVLDGVHAALFVLDPSLVVSDWNGAAARMWGLRAEAVVGREFFTLPIGDVTHAARASLERVRSARVTERVDGLLYTTPAGERRRTHLELSPILSSAGELVGILGVASGDEAVDGQGP